MADLLGTLAHRVDVTGRDDHVRGSQAESGQRVLHDLVRGQADEDTRLKLHSLLPHGALHDTTDVPDAERRDDHDDRNRDAGDDLRIYRHTRGLDRLGRIADQADNVIADRCYRQPFHLSLIHI